LRDNARQKEKCKTENFAPAGPKWGMENAMFNILAQMGQTRNTVYKEAL
jgi:hypothetical protein